MIYGVLVYDISNTTFRGRVANVMKNYGQRIQYSVFKFELTEAIYEDMLEDISKLYKEYYNYVKVKQLDEDLKKSIIILKQCKKCKENNIVFIKDDLKEKEENFII